MPPNDAAASRTRHTHLFFPPPAATIAHTPTTHTHTKMSNPTNPFVYPHTQPTRTKLLSVCTHIHERGAVDSAGHGGLDRTTGQHTQATPPLPAKAAPAAAPNLTGKHVSHDGTCGDGWGWVERVVVVEGGYDCMQREPAHPTGAWTQEEEEELYSTPLPHSFTLHSQTPPPFLLSP